MKEDNILEMLNLLIESKEVLNDLKYSDTLNNKGWVLLYKIEKLINNSSRKSLKEYLQTKIKENG